ncbi:SH2 domain-containing protein B-like isoform X2 [Phoenix dactylifera]|uniref:SH2 domain-containing protein B-like isoform X2 n=1 Tax=Phoenix dactylifera TaxID=42345 RepID=A0A8B9A9Q8_PHODC|nr:SH2 domain-containing protein B-like isoform X2 [Phoenix dactylifera]
MADEQWREEDYSKLRDLRVSLDQVGEDGEGRGDGDGDGGSGFSLCLWLYLSSSARPSSVILRQMTSENEGEVPFLALSEQNKLMLFPLMFLHKEAPSTDSSFTWTDMPHASSKIEFPLEKWVHVGCEVATNHMRLHVDGKLVGQEPVTFLSNEHQYQDNLKRIKLFGSDRKLDGYVYRAQVLPLSALITDQFVKNPPVKLSLHSSGISDGVEECGDGVWSIVGGKASCRRNFSLDVVLLNAFGRSVNKEMEIVASLVYADDGTPVEKNRDDAEAPLLISYDGLEHPSTDRPVTLLRGRATFKLKISQLSSKSDNRLFRVCFHTMHAQRYPFLEAYSHPIHCISRNRGNRPLALGKRLASTRVLLDEIHSLEGNDGSRGIRDAHGDDCFYISNQSVLRCNTPSKHSKLEHDRSPSAIDANGILEKDEMSLKTSLEVRSNNFEGTDGALSDSESTDARDYESRWTKEAVNPISDAIMFKYCLEGTHERLMLLKEMITSANDEDITNFAEQVSLYAGCSHHRYQILISRRLLQEGADTWNSITQNNCHVLWKDAVPEIDKRFRNIAHSSRGLSDEDLEVLRGIAGCGDQLGQEEFDRMWYWLYPVAFALSKEQINTMWACMSPKWIEGFITREEAENALKGPRGVQRPGTFVLRFPTSRIWPHPDAGSLVVTYVSADSTLHHKLLSLDYRKKDTRPLQELLLEERELSHLGRVSRHGNAASQS